MYFKNIQLSQVRIWGIAGTIVSVVTAIFIGCMTKKNTVDLPNSYSANPYTTWREYGGSPDQSKYTTLNQFTKENVNQLKIAWTYNTGDNVTSYKFNPLVIDNVMYVLAHNNSLVALDATNGKEIWIHTGLNTASKRGMNYWESKDRKDRRLIFCMNNTLQEIDAQTGKSILTFGTNGAVNLREGMDRDPETMTRVTSTSPGAIYDNLILLGSSPGEGTFSPPGHLRAFNVVTGKQEWIFHTIPYPGEPGYETWPKDAYKYVGGVNTWGEISIDAKRGIAYFPLGAPTYDYYGADRIGKGLYGDCILALDARTGKHIWHFQMVHHDLWDFDASAAPQLVTVMHNGQKVDAVAQATKQGFLFVFNRVTGEPLWPIDEKPVPKSTTPGEQSWPTQPVPTVVPPFSRQVVTADDINPYFTPEQKETWRKRILAAHSGLFEPLSTQYETITMPGANGGAIHGNTAADPVKGYVFVAYQDKPSVYKLKKDEPAELRVPLSADATERAKALYVQNCQACHGAEHQGGTGPNLVDINNRVTFDNFKISVNVGKGQMPSFLHLGDQNVTDMYKFLSSPPRQRGNFAGGRGGFGAAGAAKIEGPVVANGGAPGGEEFQKMPTKPLREYPAGVTPPKERYSDGSTTSYGLGYPNLLAPPWSAVAAYDLNTGKIKWRRALGNDDKYGEGKDLGLPVGSQHKGMIVTSTGIVFATCLDGRIYAYDEETGKLLWQVKLPRVPDGLLSMYEVNGKQYMAICSVSDQIDKSKPNAEVPHQYIVFALPSKK